MPERGCVKVRITNYRLNRGFFYRFKRFVARVDAKKRFKHVGHELGMRQNNGADGTMAVDDAGGRPAHTRAKHAAGAAAVPRPAARMAAIRDSMSSAKAPRTWPCPICRT